MNKLVRLSLLFCAALFSSSAYAQAPIVLHDTGNYLTEVEIESPKRSIAPTPHRKNHNKQYFSAKKAVKKPVAKPASVSSGRSKPTSMNKNYKPQMSTVRTIKPKTAPSLSAPSSMKRPAIKNIVSKPIYTAPRITNVKYPAVAAVKRKPIIVIDPGHGGKDRGTMGKLGTKEKDLVLSYSLALKKQLDNTGKYKVVLTRYDDRFIELEQRVNIARKIGGDVLISMHADSNPNKNTKGFSIYTLSSKRKNSEAQELLAKADREEVVRGANMRRESKDVKEAIIGFAQDSTKEVSDDFARTVAKSLGRRIQALPKHNREGSLAVLTGSDIPAVLIELGYLSNIQEEKTLRTDAHKQKIVTSITSAINEYFSKFNLVF